MNVLETDYWCLLLPQEWSAEQEDEVVTIVDSDDVGELSLTTLCKQTGPIEDDELLAMARQESPEISDWKPVTVGAFTGVQGRFTEEGAYVREWLVAAQNVLVVMTYFCDEENAEMDDAAVDEILNTLVVGDGGAPAPGEQ